MQESGGIGALAIADSTKVVIYK